VLQRGKSRLFRDGELLVYGGAVERVEGHPAAGDLVDVTDGAGKPLAWGAYNPDSMFRVRLLWHASDGDVSNWDPAAGSRARGGAVAQQAASRLEAVLRHRVKSAAAKRRRLGLPNAETTCFRLINAEGDRLSGLAVDVFGTTAVVSSGAVWCEKHRLAIENALLAEAGCGLQTVLWEQATSRLKQDGWVVEGLGGAAEAADGAEDADDSDFFSVESTAKELRSSEAPGSSSNAPPRETTVSELGLHYIVSLAASQKTGFYCDQRENRLVVRNLVQPGDRVLDLCCYSVKLSYRPEQCAQLLCVKMPLRTNTR
jgi:23S rRNA G2069 N7-methylase RlmK/C1962 C5-methylase RlmI